MSELKTHTEAEMRAILADHERWIDSSEKEGGRADLSLTDLRPHAALLRTSCLSRADLFRADLTDANLADANLTRANLADADLSRANLTDADLSRANLSRANLTDADLTRANLTRADLTRANLTRANLADANLSRANLTDANLSRAKGLLDPSEYLAEKFEATDEGILCYKSFESNYAPPPDWNIEPHAVITEICNPCRTTACASGVNVATLEWAQRNNRCREIWKCLIRWIDLAGVVVPYNTDGKIRASRVELIEVVR